MYIFNVFLFFFLSIRRVDTACKRLRKKQRKGIEISLTKDNFFASSRLVEATFIRSSSVLFVISIFIEKSYSLSSILFIVVRKKKKKRKIRLWAKYLTFFSIPFFLYVHLYIYISLLFLLICPPFSFSLSSHSSSFTFNSFVNCKKIFVNRKKKKKRSGENSTERTPRGHMRGIKKEFLRCSRHESTSVMISWSK